MQKFTGDDGDDDNPDEEPPSPSCMDYIMHFLTLFWKIIFAFIPPTGKQQQILNFYPKTPSHCLLNLLIVSLSSQIDMAGGYLSFVVSICCIGVVTAIIGDVASHFGCTLGIKDSVTAIVFVALGTSIPGK